MQRWITALDKWKGYDDNPIRIIPQYTEPEGRDRVVSVENLATLLEKRRDEEDYKLQGFIIFAACAGLRKTPVLSKKWNEVQLDAEFPYFHLLKNVSKNKRSNRFPLSLCIVAALKLLPSYGKDEYLFTARPNLKHRDDSKFQKPMCGILKKDLDVFRI